MKIGVIGAVPHNLIFGGGETQTINTMKYLQKTGVDIGYYDFWDKDYRCDILHIFGCHHWLYQWAMLAKQKKIKVVLSTIAYTPEKMTLKRQLYDSFDRILPLDTSYRMTRKLIQLSDVLLPNSYEEQEYLKRMLRAGNKCIKIIPNAADIRYKYGDKNLFKEKYNLENFVLCVGKIEPRKNQLNLVKAFENTKVPLVLVGSYIPNEKWYYDEVIKVIENKENMVHIEYFPYDSDILSGAYAAAKVHVLLGKNETPGIVNLEAGLAGANLVVGDCAPVKEYLKNYALYCDYNSLEDIYNKVMQAFDREKDDKTSKFIEENYTWEVVARRTKEVYNYILEK